MRNFFALLFFALVCVESLAMAQYGFSSEGLGTGTQAGSFSVIVDYPGYGIYQNKVFSWNKDNGRWETASPSAEFFKQNRDGSYTGQDGRIYFNNSGVMELEQQSSDAGRTNGNVPSVNLDIDLNMGRAGSGQRNNQNQGRPAREGNTYGQTADYDESQADNTIGNGNNRGRPARGESPAGRNVGYDETQLGNNNPSGRPQTTAPGAGYSQSGSGNQGNNNQNMGRPARDGSFADTIDNAGVTEIPGMPGFGYDVSGNVVQNSNGQWVSAGMDSGFYTKNPDGSYTGNDGQTYYESPDGQLLPAETSTPGTPNPVTGGGSGNPGGGGGDAFEAITEKLTELYEGLKGVVYTAALLAFIGFAVAGMLGKLDWKKVAILGAALFILSIADYIVTYVVG